MKKVILTAIISLLTVVGYSQENPQVYHDSLRYQRDALLIKAQKQKKAAWICLGTGVALIPISVLSYYAMNVEGGTALTGTLFLSGIALTIISIPKFIASGKNKHKANLLVTSQKAAFISPLAVSKKVTGLTLSIAL